MVIIGRPGKHDATVILFFPAILRSDPEQRVSSESEKQSHVADASLTAFEARHLQGALALSQEMGWPYRLDDWEFAASLGQGLALERDGKLIGTAMWWTFGQRHASVGMIIVSAAEQGRGYGALLVDTLLNALAGRDMLLCATEEGLALYQRRGFIETGAVCQHQGLCQAAAAQAQKTHTWLINCGPRLSDYVRGICVGPALCGDRHVVQNTRPNCAR